MSLATLGDLKSAIASFLNRPNLAVQAPTFIQLAEARIAFGSGGGGAGEGQFSSEALRVRAMESSADIAIVTATAPLPDDYLQARRFYLATDPVAELRFVVPDIFWKSYSNSSAGQPAHFTIEAGNFVFGPLPDAPYAGKLLYYARFPALVNDSDSNWLLANAPGVYLHGALLEAYRFTRNMDKAADEHLAFAGAVNALNLADKGDRYSGSPWQAMSDTGNP